MSEEFNLSEKLTFGDTGYKEPFIHQEDVKEFIKRLKEELMGNGYISLNSYDEICRILRKIAGEKLCQK